jgi:hypothetical protein
MNPEEGKNAYHRVRIARALENFSRKGFDAHYFQTGAEAVEHFFSQVDKKESVGHGGSDTLRQLGVLDRLRTGGYNFLDRYVFGPSYDEQLVIRRQNLCADAFVASSNAVAIGGALVNIDGDGNRVAALAFGPRHVHLFIGRNKLCDDLESAMYRARDIASVALAIQCGVNTPCAKTASCHDCASPDRVCSYVSIIEHCTPSGRIKLYFINEDLGM